MGDRPYCYVDDDLTPELMSWAARRDKELPTLYLQPDPDVGLERWHLGELRIFAERVKVWREQGGPNSTHASGQA